MIENLPFKYGTDYCQWMYKNCDRCSKAGDASIPGSSNCAIFEAIHDAATGIDIPDKIAMRFGTKKGETFAVFQDCPERVEVILN